MKSGSVAVVGLANAGKSTLINVLVGEKVSIVSPKPQTTRDKILGVLTEKDFQIVFEDTPGIYKSDTLLSGRMQKTAETSVRDVDVILFALDGHEGVSEKNLNLLSKFIGKGVPVIVAFTKIDIMPKEKIPEELSKIAQVKNVNEIVPVSARKGRNLKELISVILNYLPNGERLFSEDIISDKSEKFMIKEIMREKLLLLYEKEIPHGINVTVNDFKRRNNGIYDISLDIICEKENHKAIIIGKQGLKLKEVNTFAREAMEKFLGSKVFLTTYVVVKEKWRDNETLLDEFGYGNNRIKR